MTYGTTVGMMAKTTYGPTSYRHRRPAIRHSKSLTDTTHKSHATLSVVGRDGFDLSFGTIIEASYEGRTSYEAGMKDTSVATRPTTLSTAICTSTTGW